jgi:hypothetical protein
MLIHNVYFTLSDDSSAARKHLIAECNKHLPKIPGITFFAAGTLVEDLNRPVNDRGFHVGLHVVFKDRAAHDAYQVDERHKRFIAGNSASWKQVRVFDSEE